MNCINLEETIDQGLKKLRQVEFGSEQYKNGSAGLAKLIEADSKQIEADKKANESDVSLDMQKEKNEFEAQMALKRLDLDKSIAEKENQMAIKRFDLDKSIAEKELEVKQLQLESETKTSIIRTLPALVAGAVCITEIGVQAHLEETGHLWSPLRGLSNLANKLRF